MTTTDVSHASTTSRRSFLKGIGAGAGILTLTPSTAILGHLGGSSAAAASTAADQFFGRMFPGLPPFAPNSSALQQALTALGAKDGPMDAQDDLDAGPIDLIVDPELSENNPDNPTMSAGMTFVGQFVDHDVTFDGSSELAEPADPEEVENLRTPTMDLDSVYGGGPVATPELYENDGMRLRVGHGGLFEDLPRDGDDTAIIGDPRNDENVMIAGLHAAFLLFHNKVVDMVESETGLTDPAEIFAEARRIVTWHYQWILVHEVIPKFVGHGMVQDILGYGRQHFTPSQLFMPVEFQGACYRFGHSLVRPSYRANFTGENGEPFFGMIFDPAEEGMDDPDDLRGGVRAPRRFIDWQTFFDFQDGEVRPNKKVMTTISTPLFELPLAAIGPDAQPPIALPARNLLRHITWGLPSGQTLADEMGLSSWKLTSSDLDDLSEFSGSDFDLQEHTPLWFYILREADLQTGGWHLGQVGGRIVGEVLLGLIQDDPDSYLSNDPSWQPELPGHTGGVFTIRDLLEFAEVDPSSRASA